MGVGYKLEFWQLFKGARRQALSKLSHEEGPAQSEKTESNKTRCGSFPETTVAVAAQKFSEEIQESGAALT